MSIKQSRSGLGRNRADDEVFSKEEQLHTWLLSKERQARLGDFPADDEVFRKKKSCAPGFC